MSFESDTAAALARIEAALAARAPLLVSAVLLPPASMAAVPVSDPTDNGRQGPAARDAAAPPPNQQGDTNG